MSDDRNQQLRIERAALGELDPALLNEAEREQARALAAENAQFLLDHPVRPVVAEIRRRATAPRERATARPWWLAVPALAAVATVLLVVRTDPGATDLEVGRSKGHSQLLIHRATEAGVEKLQNGDGARAGDRLQLGYASGASGYGVVVSVDGAGAITVHWPKSGEPEAVALEPQGATLPFSYELDAAPRLERFFLVDAEQAFPVAQVVDAVRAMSDPEHAALALPSGWSQTSLLLRKVEP